GDRLVAGRQVPPGDGARALKGAVGGRPGGRASRGGGGVRGGLGARFPAAPDRAAPKGWGSAATGNTVSEHVVEQRPVALPALFVITLPRNMVIGSGDEWSRAWFRRETCPRPEPRRSSRARLP